jgi:micrococcal nuclease
MHEYKCKIIKIVDGDDVDIDLGFGIWLRKERVRVMGIDTPESRTSDKIEKIFGLAAKNRLISLLGAEAILHTQVSKKGEDMKGKFGRVLGNFTSINGEKCAAVLIREGHAVAYEGGSKENIASQHIENRKKLILEKRIHWRELGAGSMSEGLDKASGFVKNPPPLEPNDAPIVKTATPAPKATAKKTTKKKTAKKK